MLYRIENDRLAALVSDSGAELQSLLRKEDEAEYLWQGDPAVWDGRAPNLFPICGRLTGKTYTWEGKEYRLDTHGFAKDSLFAADPLAHDAIRFVLTDTVQTRKDYPFSFRFCITYRLIGNALAIEFAVKNTGNGVLPFSLGAHPAFRLFSDLSEYSLEFARVCSPSKLVFTPSGMRKGTVRYALEDGTTLRLSHEMFDLEDSLFFTDIPDTVTLKSASGHRITVSCPDAPYIGFWQMPNLRAPYLCIEPWFGTPSPDGVVDDFATKADMIRLDADACFTAVVTVTLE